MCSLRSRDVAFATPLPKALGAALLKKALVAGAILFVLLISWLSYTVAPYVATPAFTVINETDGAVEVTATWRDQSKSFGSIDSRQRVEFEVSAEAAMSFTASFANGTVLSSEPIYFTSGLAITATIQDERIDVTYDERT